MDDNPSFHSELKAALGRHYEFAGAIDASGLFKKLQNGDEFDLIMLDLVLDGSARLIGLDLLPKIKELRPETPLVVVTNDKEVETVVAAIKGGAENFIHKGKKDYELWDQVIRKAVEGGKVKAENKHLRQEVQRYREKETEEFPFIGRSTIIQEVKDTLLILSEDPNISVLITGETGTGKEVAARYLHQHGMRKDKSFIAVNLSAISESLLESELFGHIKGAFTGASQAKEGYFRQANGGVLMLDEIGDINPDIQIKLLRFLERKLIRPVGSDNDIQLDVQVVAATHRDLKSMVAEGTFRQDLFMRLKTVEVRLPPLRERLSDLNLLLDHYLQQAGMSRDLIRPGTYDRILSYPWHGNIRELVSAVQYISMRRKILKTDVIDDHCLPYDIRDHRPGAPAAQAVTANDRIATATASVTQELSREEEVAVTDLRRIEQALLEKNYVKGDAAKMAGLENTDNLRYCIRKYYKQFPTLFVQFPAIKKAFGKIVK
ncbi:MAG TPA: sigma-54 dependent transcriptional regulator [Flavilitoribacter sp.]|nr:sigma-54 dependent transcriptional regulator [Flavilitoribacter sp.]HMQ86375.1 sigma-54 dependent transcriptional regulator [Flavilitoribacter sp.]